MMNSRQHVVRACNAVEGRAPRIGATLMELVVAGALMSTLMLGMWGLVNTFTSLSGKGGWQLHRIREATNMLAQIERDVRSAVVLPGENRQFFSGGPENIDILAAAPPWRHGEINRSVDERESVGDIPEPTVQNVYYYTRSFADQRVFADTWRPHFNGLARHERRGSSEHEGWLDRHSQFPFVETIRFSYYDGRRWNRRWDGQLHRELPRAIRIEAWLHGGSPLAAKIPEQWQGDLLADESVGQSTPAPTPEAQEKQQEQEQLRDPENSIAAPRWQRPTPERRPDLIRIVAL